MRFFVSLLVFSLTILAIESACPLNKLKIVQYYFDCKAKFDDNKNCILKCILKKLKCIVGDKPDVSKLKSYRNKCKEELKDPMICEVVDCIQDAMECPTTDYSLPECAGYCNITACIPI